MTEAQITALINLGAAGAVIIVVVYFLRFIEKRDKDWQAFFQSLLSSKDTPTAQLVELVQALLEKFTDHDTWTRVNVESMRQAINEPKTQSRKRTSQ